MIDKWIYSFLVFFPEWCSNDSNHRIRQDFQLGPHPEEPNKSRTRAPGDQPAATVTPDQRAEARATEDAAIGCPHPPPEAGPQASDHGIPFEPASSASIRGQQLHDQQSSAYRPPQPILSFLWCLWQAYDTRQSAAHRRTYEESTVSMSNMSSQTDPKLSKEVVTSSLKVHYKDAKIAKVPSTLTWLISSNYP